MDKGALTDVLEVVLTRVHAVSSATHDVSIATPEGHHVLTEIREGMINQDLAEEIVLPVLEMQPEFKDKAPMINSGTGLSGFQSQFVASMLVREARGRKSAKAAVAWLEKVLGTDSAAGLAIQTLWGIAPTQRISISEGVDLLPLESLPPSRQKDRCTDDHWPPTARRLPLPPFAWKPPTAALVAKTEVRPFLIDASTEKNSKDNNVREAYPPLEDIRLCLALEGPSIIITGLSWFQYVDPDLEAAILGEGSTSYINREVLPLYISADSPVVAIDVQAIVREYMALKPAIRNRLRIALEHLQQALIRSDPFARTLEIAIALEALLIDSSGEHTFKLAYRAALLVSDDVDERIATRAVITAAYVMRSSLMHGGRRSGTVKVIGQEKEPVKEVASKAAKITALVIKRIIMEGGLPEWNQFELSDGKTWKH